MPPGTRITFRAITTGSAGPIEYQFWRYDRNTQTWTSTGYSASDSYVWTPSALDAGSSIVQVWVRVVGSSAAYNAWATTGTFSIWP